MKLSGKNVIQWVGRSSSYKCWHVISLPLRSPWSFGCSCSPKLFGATKAPFSNILLIEFRSLSKLFPRLVMRCLVLVNSGRLWFFRLPWITSFEGGCLVALSMNIVCLRIQSSGRRKRKITVLVESLPKNKWRNKCLPSLVFAVDMASIYPCITMRLIMEMTFNNSSFVDRGNVPCTLGRHHPPGHPYLSMGAGIPTHYGHTFISLWIIIVVCLGSEWVDIFYRYKTLCLQHNLLDYSGTEIPCWSAKLYVIKHNLPD